jgi:hypothetical protein
MILRAARLTLLGSLAVYGLSFLIMQVAPEVGLLVCLVTTICIALSAFACIAIQLATAFGRRRHKPVEKPE